MQPLAFSKRSRLTSYNTIHLHRRSYHRNEIYEQYLDPTFINLHDNNNDLLEKYTNYFNVNVTWNSLAYKGYTKLY